ncbi:hypothetical protein COT48_04475 [Candidatus Woesearchaeota archaeon CG08_land_8_20_14_0_20_47_9]|nr:MAG: hypothetical protein AUJ69_02970 [Candidatus Woesearchaeota archaeon CG1_02_47_18]PIN76493.1 MAG: hypothetical protein COV22_00335 [Candidatus Woesearchaeota archaeon CG10_big_fil_rev_8_21_14_0_10_47_5]PIO03517.1 MAG: hypothetical protein COT48_04475 [Candidatus Woesearchaeota archaeon CG08_land_8_20_14_0_20_47_9]HII30115.1 hypothetical protein [Candidatus Woesearchaeota archaeon]
MYQKRDKKLDVLALYLGGYTKQFYLREVSKLTRVPLRTTQNLLLELEKEKILKSVIRGRNRYFKLNLSNIQTKFYLLQAEVYKTAIFANYYPFFNIFLKDIKTNSPIIVFGSFAECKADKDSDLDLLVLSKDKLPLHLLPYKVHKIEMLKSSFEKALVARETLLKEIEENHVILNNHSFYVNEMWRAYGERE